MEKRTCTSPKKQAGIDLLLILLIMAVVLTGFLIAVNSMGSSGGSNISGADGSGTSGTSLLLQTFVGALMEFSMMGLGITVVCLLRRESFWSFGLKKEHFFQTIALSALVCIPSFLNLLFTAGVHRYFPFHTVSFTDSLLTSGFPINILGLLLVVLSWGFFEGFTYVVLCDRINKLLPSKHLLLNWGAILCGLGCLLLHTALNLPPESFLAGLSEFLVIYGMLVIWNVTGNAWGCIFIYLFFWNALS